MADFINSSQAVGKSRDALALFVTRYAKLSQALSVREAFSEGVAVANEVRKRESDRETRALLGVLSSHKRYFLRITLSILSLLNLLHILL